MLPEGPHRDAIHETRALLHDGKKAKAALCFADFAGIKVEIKDDDDDRADKVLGNLFHWLLNNDQMDEAAQLVWAPEQFDPRPSCTQSVWRCFDEQNFCLIMGASSMSKSYSLGVRLFLEWVRDPRWTTVRVIGPSQDHLEENLFSHLVSLHSQAKIKMPGSVGQLFIGLNRRDLTSAIKGVVIPVGKNKKAGKVQGAKRKARDKRHPVFGQLSRLFVFLDEIENVPAGVWFDIDNLMSNYEETQKHTLRIFGAYNPSNPGDKVAQAAEPPFGWKDFDVDRHFEWDSKRGWHVLRLDAEQSENVKQDKVVYDGLQTRSGLEMLAKNNGGRESAGYYTFGRGAYPLQGAAMSVFAPGLLGRMRGEYVWYDDPVAVAGCDLALTGGAYSSYALGRMGRVVGIKYPASIEYPQGNTVMFKDARGRPQIRMGAQLDHLFRLPKGDTEAVKEEVMKMNKKCGVRPEYFACDRTGPGAGCSDLLRNHWSSAIHDVNYSGSASELRVMMEDKDVPYDAYHLVCSELWFAAQMWGEFGYFLIHPHVELYNELNQQLVQRLYRYQGKKKRVEPKEEYKARGFTSPDEADATTLFVHAARMGSQYIPSMAGEGDTAGFDEDDWYPMQVVDSTNITDSL